MDLQSQFNADPHIDPVFIFFLKPGERTHVGVQIQVEVDDGFHVIVVVVRDARSAPWGASWSRRKNPCADGNLAA